MRSVIIPYGTVKHFFAYYEYIFYLLTFLSPLFCYYFAQNHFKYSLTNISKNCNITKSIILISKKDNKI
ncbi:MAG: hypothetical protein CVU97_05475 [Firmicutes bacterium HGW-Firmicutes-21]|nr:MAG: hypothetical protein CVU97_05475 [Firmicutes bacterium HGW-Firmicutes-21]